MKIDKVPLLQRKITFIHFCFYSFLITVFFLGCGSYYGYHLLKQPVVKQATPIVFLVPHGMSTQHALLSLYKLQLVPHLNLMQIYLRIHSKHVLKSGEYEFHRGESILDIWQQLEQGQGFHQRVITFIPGWTFTQVKDALKHAPGVIHTLERLSERELLNHLHVTAYPSIEGLLFPETYHYTWGTKDITLLTPAVALMEKKLMHYWVNRALNLPYREPAEALIAASLVEKEVKLPIERPLVASVLVNRLRLGMPLQFDPTVIYAMGSSYTGKIYKRDLHNPSLYNTYLHKGLPPTAIAIPSEASLRAVLQPAETSFLYFVARSDQIGAHHFSSTLTEHNRAVALSKQHQPSSIPLHSDILTKPLQPHRTSDTH